MTPRATSITIVAEEFFAACETGKGWDVCNKYCTLNATSTAQAEPLLEVKTLADYTNWMKGIMTVLPDAHYEVKSFATDTMRNNVAAYGVFHGTHTGEGGPVPVPRKNSIRIPAIRSRTVREPTAPPYFRHGVFLRSTGGVRPRRQSSLHPPCLPLRSGFERFTGLLFNFARYSQLLSISLDVAQ